MRTPKVYGPDAWQIRCTRCNAARSLREAGGYRVGPKPIGKRTLGWCRACRWLRWLAVELKPDIDADSEGAGGSTAARP